VSSQKYVASFSTVAVGGIGARMAAGLSWNTRRHHMSYIELSRPFLVARHQINMYSRDKMLARIPKLKPGFYYFENKTLIFLTGNLEPGFRFLFFVNIRSKTAIRNVLC